MAIFLNLSFFVYGFLILLYGIRIMLFQTHNDTSCHSIYYMKKGTHTSFFFIICQDCVQKLQVIKCHINVRVTPHDILFICLYRL